MNKKAFTWLILFVTIILFWSISLFVMLIRKEYDFYMVFRNFIVNLPIVICMTIFNVKIVSELRKRISNLPVRYIIEAGLSLGLILLILFLTQPVNISTTDYEDFDPFQWKVIIPASFLNFMIIILVESFYYHDHVTRMIQEQARLNQEKAEFQLMALKNQVNPHFLFNSLNVLSSLTYQSPDTANRFTKKLAQIYRYLLDNSSSRVVPLHDELTFVNNYIYLQQIRFQKGLQVIVKINVTESDKRQVIPTSIQMAVENAIKHNTCSSRLPLCITIEDHVDYILVENNLQLKSQVTSHGTGHQNLNKQLSYYQKELQIITDRNNYKVMIPVIPLK